MDLITTEAKQTAEQTETLARSYDNYAIVSAEGYADSAADLTIIKTKAKDLEALRKSLTKPLDESKKKIMEFFNKPKEYLASAEKSIKSAMIGWQNEQTRIRQAEQERLAKIQQEETNRLRLEAEAESARIAQLKTQADKIAAAEKVAELTQQAEAVAEQEAIIIPEPEPVKGLSKRKVWKFEVVDISQLPAEYLISDDKMIGQMIRATQGKVPISGVRIYSEDTIISR